MSDVKTTWVERLTPPGRGAVATLRVTGERAVACVEAVFSSASGKSLECVQVGRILFGRIGQGNGEELVVCKLAPECVEIHCHGGVAAVQRIEVVLRDVGVQLDNASWKQSPSDRRLETAAWEMLAQASTERTAAILLDQAQGALRNELSLILNELRSSPTHAAKRLQTLLARASLGTRLAGHFEVVFAGPPNVGKSSLLNALLGFKRAIVHDQPGTTRDIVRSTTAIEGWPVQFSDTAGIRVTSDPLEVAGRELAKQSASRADLVVEVLDTVRAFENAEKLDWQFPAALRVVNKADLLAVPPPSLSQEVLLVSARTGQGLDVLQRAIAERLVGQPPEPGAAAPFHPEAVNSLNQASDLMRLGDMAGATAVVEALLD
jgi:tRNA modification GTPase